MFFVLCWIIIGVLILLDKLFCNSLILGLIFWFLVVNFICCIWCIRVLVCCIERFLVMIIWVVFVWLVVFSGRIVLVCFIFRLLCLISLCVFGVKFIRCKRLVIVVWDLFMVLVICWWVNLNLFWKCCSVEVFLIGFRFLCWIFLISVIVMVVLLVIDCII